MPIKNLPSEQGLCPQSKVCALPTELVRSASRETRGWRPSLAAAIAAVLTVAASCDGPEPSGSAPQGASQSKPEQGVPSIAPKAASPGPVSAAELRFRVYPWLVKGSSEGASSPEIDTSVGLLALDPTCGIAIVPRVRDGNVYREATSAEAALVEGFGPKLATIYRENLARLFTEAGPLTVVGDPSGPGMRFLDLDTDIAGTEALILLPETWDKVEATLGRAALLALPDRKLCRFLSAGPWLVNVEMAKDFAKRHREGSTPLAAGFLWRDATRIRVGPSFAGLAQD